MKVLSAQDLASFYPVLFHMAAADSWQSIQSLGLLSTARLVEQFDVPEPLASDLVTKHRPESVRIESTTHGNAIVRDQKPMSYGGLARALPPGTSAAEWITLLNSMVFFWPTVERLKRFINAREYRGQRKTILVFDTLKTVSSELERVRLSRLNSGCTKPFPHLRSTTDTFLPISEYGFWERKSRGLDPLAEVAIQDGVSDVPRLVNLVVEVGGDQPPATLFGSSDAVSSFLAML